MISEIRYRMQGTSDLVPAFVRSILSDVSKLKKIDEEDNFDIKIVLNELVANAIIHGNKKNDNKPVSVNIKFENKKLSVSVKNKGLRPFLIIKRWFSGKRKSNELRENGNGLLLVESLFGPLRWNLACNRVLVEKCLKTI